MKHIYYYKYFSRSSHSQVFFKIDFQKKKKKKNRKFHRKTPVLESLFNKVVGLKAVTQVFPVKFAKSLRTIVSQNTSDGCF